MKAVSQAPERREEVAQGDLPPHPGCLRREGLLGLRAAQARFPRPAVVVGWGLPRPGSRRHRDRDKGPRPPRRNDRPCTRACARTKAETAGRVASGFRKPLQLHRECLGRGSRGHRVHRGPAAPVHLRPPCRRGESTRGGTSAETRFPWSSPPDPLGWACRPHPGPQTQFAPLDSSLPSARPGTRHTLRGPQHGPGSPRTAHPPSQL